MADTYQVIITEPAEKDIESILNYILIEKGSYQGAANVKRDILDAIIALGEMPDRHGKVKEIEQRENMVYRRVIVNKKYRVIYKIEETEQDVYVVRVLHVRRGPAFVKSALE